MQILAIRCFLSVADNLYYEGDRLSADDIEVPRRPSPQHTWDSGVSNWVLNNALQVASDNANIAAQILVKEAQCIRPLRELERQTNFADVPLVVVTAAKARLKQLDDDIAALRAQLK
jgi:hypothetical protein